MQREKVVPNDIQHWLSLRLQDITSTQSPALFNLSPYLTKFELYHSKASGLSLDFEENERMTWGKRLEPVIAAGVAEDNGWKLRKINEYIRIPEINMGSSFDYEVVCPQRGLGILEIKNVDYYVFGKKWVDEQAPEDIEIQLQHQLEVKDDCNWGCIAAFVGGNRPEEFIRERDRDMGAGLVAAVRKFWDDVKHKREPEPNFDRDGDAIKRLYKGSGEMLDREADTELAGLAASYLAAQKAQTEAEKQQKNFAAQILRRLGNSSGAYTRQHRIKAKPVAENLGKKVTQDMVGTTIGTRKGHHRLYVKDMGNDDGDPKRSKA